MDEVLRSGVREGDLAEETKPAVRRARVWVAVKKVLNNVNGNGQGSSHGHGGAGSDERDGDEMGDEY